MTTKIDLHKCFRALVVGDTAFFESKKVDSNSHILFGKWILSQEWFRPFAPEDLTAEMLGEDCDNRMATAIMMKILGADYSKLRLENRNPDWLEKIPKEIAREIVHSYLTGDAFDQYAMVSCLPHSGFGYVVFEDGLVQEIDGVFGLRRLMGIRQLASLHDPTVEHGDRKNEQTLPFTHTRYVHSLDVCAIATLIGAQCGLTENDFLTLRIAAQSHDALTPAGGDSIKCVDPAGLDEDANYPELFRRPGWQQFQKKHAISETLLAKTILGEGLLGSILDASDKLAYTGRDLNMFLAKNPPGSCAWEDFGDTYDRITSILRANPYPCSVWECAEVRRGQLVFTDGDRLADFFRIRALMFKILYNNASARFSEAGYVGEVAKVLYEDKVITRESLLEMKDEMLFSIMADALKLSGRYIMESVHGADPRIEKFRTAEDALCFEREIAAIEPATMTHLDTNTKHPTSFLKRFKVLAGRKIVPFETARPYEAWDIKQIVRDEQPYRVFMYNLEALCPDKTMFNRLLEGRNLRIASSPAE